MRGPSRSRTVGRRAREQWAVPPPARDPCARRGPQRAAESPATERSRSERPKSRITASQAATPSPPVSEGRGRNSLDGPGPRRGPSGPCTGAKRLLTIRGVLSRVPGIPQPARPVQPRPVQPGPVQPGEEPTRPARDRPPAGRGRDGRRRGRAPSRRGWVVAGPCPPGGQASDPRTAGGTGRGRGRGARCRAHRRDRRRSLPGCLAPAGAAGGRPPHPSPESVPRGRAPIGLTILRRTGS